MAPKKGKKTTRKNTGSTKTATLSPHDDIDVTTEDHIGKLKELFAKHPVVLVFVYADWCGHCTTFKPTWEEYKKTPNRKVPIARVNETVLKQTPVADAKLDGFPSLALMGNDGKLASFKKEDGSETHAIPNMRDKKAMTMLLTTDPGKLKKVNNGNANNGNNGNNADNDPSEGKSVTSTPEAENLMIKSGEKAVESKDDPVVVMPDPSPPNTSADRADNDVRPRQPIASVGGSGGSLYKSLLRAANGVFDQAPAPSKRVTRRKGKGLRTTKKLR